MIDIILNGLKVVNDKSKDLLLLAYETADFKMLCPGAAAIGLRFHQVLGDPRCQLEFGGFGSDK